ncbi:hypothetical protein OB13_16515 [Pontibacter sp. HJ8]
MLKLIYPLLALALLTQCQQEETPLHTETQSESSDLKFGQEVLLQHREQVTLFGGDVPRRLIVSLEGIQDSRCPANANCVTAGSASIILRASNSQGSNDKIELCIGDCSPEPPRNTHTVTALVGETTYRFTLKEVKPYPGLEIEGEVQKARLVVEKL